MNPDKLQEPIINANERYRGAWFELTARLRNRLTIRLAYLTSSWFILGTALKLLTDMFETDFINVTSFSIILVVVIVISSQLLSVLFTCWSLYEDSIIGQLSAFCATYEERDGKNNFGYLPSWHNVEQPWINEAAKFRGFIDKPFRWVLGANGIIGTVIIIYLGLPFLSASLVVLVILILALWAIGNTYVSQYIRTLYRYFYIYDWELAILIKKSPKLVDPLNIKKINFVNIIYLNKLISLTKQYLDFQLTLPSDKKNIANK